MPQNVRMKDIAERVGVSTVTVSKALGGHRGVSQEMRQRIEQTAKEMGYQMSKGRTERSRVSYNIGILMAERYFDRYNSFYGNLQQFVTAEATNMSCFTMIEVVSSEDERQDVIPKILLDEECDGILVMGWMEEHYLENLQGRLPMLYLDFSVNNAPRDCVISDSFYGAYQMTNYLFMKGHRDIGFVGTLLSTSSITDRYLGYCKSLMEHGVEIRKDWLLEDRDLTTGLMDIDKFFVLPDQMPTAFVCNCDLTASYLHRKLTSKGYSCPEDVSIVGYDNFLYQGLTDIGFTTYEVDTKEMARKAVHNLIHKLNREYYRKGVVIVTGHLVERGSVKLLEAGK